MTEDRPASGIAPEMSYEDYEAMLGIRHSNLWVLHERTPLHYRYRVDHPDEFDSEAYQRGRATHVACLEPERFDEAYVTAPAPPSGDKWDLRYKAHKQAMAEFQEANTDRIVLTQAKFDTCRFMRDAVLKHKAAKDIIDAAQAEVVAWWNDATHGCGCKARADLWAPAGVIADLKTTKCAAASAFGRDAYNYGYHSQMTYYRDGFAVAAELDDLDIVIIAAEHEPPYGVALYDMGPDEQAVGREQYKHALRSVAECREKNWWPGYRDGIMLLMLPSYAGMDLYSGRV